MATRYQLPDNPNQPLGSIQPPMVYVHENSQWEYKQLTVNVSESTTSEDDLNALGQEGWELVGIVQHEAIVNYTFKRQK